MYNKNLNKMKLNEDTLEVKQMSKLMWQFFSKKGWSVEYTSTPINSLPKYTGSAKDNKRTVQIIVDPKGHLCQVAFYAFSAGVDLYGGDYEKAKQELGAPDYWFENPKVNQHVTKIGQELENLLKSKYPNWRYGFSQDRKNQAYIMQFTDEAPVKENIEESKPNKMNKELLRMQMLAGVITEGQYKEKVEELAAENLELKALAKQIYQYFKSIKLPVKLITTKIDVGTKGAWEGGNVLISATSANDDQVALDINSAGIGFDQAKKFGEMAKNSFPKAVFTPVNGKYDWNSNPIVSFLITPGKEMSESLNEHYVAGGIVGIGAVNQIPSRAKADYEDAFEYFLSQKYPLNEADEATAVGEKVEAAVEDKLEATVDKLSDEQKDQLRAELAKAGITADSKIEDVAGKLDESLTEVEGDTKAKVASALSDIGGGLIKSLLVPIIPVAIGSMGPGVAAGFAITAAVAGGLIGLAKLLGAEKSMEEGKEVEEPTNY